MSRFFGPECTIGQLCEAPELAPFAPYFFTKMTPDVWGRTLAEYGFEKCAFTPTLALLQELAASGRTVDYPLYTPGETAQDAEKAGVRLLHLPGPAHSPVVIVCPGGGYARQWGLIEGLAVGAELVRLGCTALVLYYRTHQFPPFDKPIMPAPVEDLARAVAWMQAHAEAIGADPRGYAVAGFSAGAHLAAEWGTVNLGSRTHDAPAPAALLLGYASVNTAPFYRQFVERGARSDDPGAYYLLRICGPEVTPEKLALYDIDAHMDAAYPPTYLVACRDDPIVPIENSFLMDRRLTELGVPHVADIGATGGHSFGVGNGTDVDGWLTRAVAFWLQRR